MKLSRPQHFVLIIYLLCLSYCFMWIPWRVQMHTPGDRYRPTGHARMGYGWLWSGPRDSIGYESALFATPDASLIRLRVAAATSLAAAAILLVGFPTRRKQ